MERILLLIHVGDVFLDAAFVEIDLFVSFASGIAGRSTVVTENNPHPTIEVGQLAQTRGESLVVELNAGRENLDIGLKAHRCSGAALLTSG